MAKRLILIHGRNFKPAADFLEGTWCEALRHGLQRDFGDGAGTKFDRLVKDFVYYGDISNEFLYAAGKDYDEEHNRKERRETLDDLKTIRSNGFTSRAYRRRTDGSRGFKELLADTFSGPLNLFGVADNLIELVAPDLKEYWNQESAFGSAVRWSLTAPLSKALHNNDDVMLVSHSLGTMIAYDVLWKFSFYGEHQDIRDRRLSQWITLGSPLGNPTVQANLKGGNLKGDRKHPVNVAKWINFAAEDDFISHDQSIADDFREMRAAPARTRITDRRMYNLALVNPESDESEPNQHHGAGYLIHPGVAKAVHSWMSS